MKGERKERGEREKGREEGGKKRRDRKRDKPVLTQ